MKSQENRIEDAAVALVSELRWRGDLDRGREIARAMLEAADRESPKWPTDKSVKAFTSAANTTGGWHSHEGRRAALRAALLADPIVKAAVALVAYWGDAQAALLRVADTPPGALVRAVREAGL